MKLRQWLRRFGSGEWGGWPEQAYQRDAYQQRLSAVQEHLAECLDAAPPGPVHIISICAGDGRDVIGVLESHPRRDDVSAWLVESNEQSVDFGIRRAQSAGLERTVNFVNEDATDYVTYRNMAPADIVLVCGVWGHVPTPERKLLLRAIASLCKPNGVVIWTRGVSKGMHRLHEIEALFAESPTAWATARISLTSDKKWGVVTHRYCGQTLERPEAGRIFRFERSAGR